MANGQDPRFKKSRGKTFKPQDRLVDKWTKDDGLGAKGWLEKYAGKKTLKPALEFLTGAGAREKGQGSAMDLAMAAPVIGQVGKVARLGIRGAKKIPAIGAGIKNLLFKNKYLHEGAVTGASGRRQMMNRRFADIMGGSEFSPVGQVQTPAGKMTDVFISDKSMQYAGREMRTVAYKGKKSTLLQPFYKSTGQGTPELKTTGEWMPFEGILTRSAKIKSWEAGGSGIVQTSRRSGGLKEVPFGNDPGWIIKGHRRPGVSKIMGESGKRGLTMHKETSKMLQSYFNK